LGFESSGQGLGSTFYFELPLYSAASAGVDPTSTPAQLLSPPRENRNIPVESSISTFLSAVESGSPNLGTSVPVDANGDLGREISNNRVELQASTARTQFGNFFEILSLGSLSIFVIHSVNPNYYSL